jgi:hypothetical protein
MENSKYWAAITESDNLYVVRSTYPSAVSQTDSFAHKEEALDYAEDLVKIGKVTSVEVRRIMRVIRKI